MIHKDTDLELVISRLLEASRLYGLTFSLGNTEVLFQSVTSTFYRPYPFDLN